MKAAVFKDIKTIEYMEDYPKPSIGPDDALVRVHYCGICGSDIVNFKDKLYQVPLIMGHELIGEVVELGENLTDFIIGDKVVGVNVKLDVTSKQLLGLGVFIDGGFAEYVKIPKQFLFHAPKSTPLKEGSLVESFSVAVRAVKKSRMEENQKVVILGGGSIGMVTLMTILVLKKPEYIVVIEPHEFLRNKALNLGATAVFPPSKAQLRKFFRKNGSPNYVFECAGNEKSFNMAMDIVNRGGSIILEGLSKGKLIIPLLLILSKEVNIQGVLSHDREDILDAVKLLDSGKIDSSKFISKIITLKDIQETFESYLVPGERKFLKIIVEI